MVLAESPRSIASSSRYKSSSRFQRGTGARGADGEGGSVFLGFTSGQRPGARLPGGDAAGLADLQDLDLFEDAVRDLGALEDLLHQIAARVDAALLEPVDDIRLAAHRPHLDHLAAADPGRRDGR